MLHILIKLFCREKEKSNNKKSDKNFFKTHFGKKESK